MNQLIKLHKKAENLLWDAQLHKLNIQTTMESSRNCKNIFKQHHDNAMFDQRIAVEKVKFNNVMKQYNNILESINKYKIN